MMTKHEIPASRTDSITAKRNLYAVNRPPSVAGQQLGIQIDRTGWADAQAALTVTMEISHDGGTTWRLWCGLTARGGVGLPTAEWSATAPPADAAIRIIAASNGRPVKQPFALLEGL